MVQIANPIYDIVFKYMMHDEKVARLLLSAIIGQEVVSLEFRPTEHHFPLGDVLTVLRMDFSARIIDDQGRHQLIILELQKAKLASDIMRFRRYLGEQYSNKENIVREEENEYVGRKALPILSIYFLGHKLEHTDAPVIRVNRRYIDAATGDEILEKEVFIESLTHDSIIIQIPYLGGKRRTELEQLLALFDQTNRTEDHHLLNISEDELPERYRPLLRRLHQAIAEPEIRQTMEAEDDLIEEFRDYQRMISAKEQLIAQKEQTIFAKNEIISEKEKILIEKDLTISEKERALSEKNLTISEKEKALSEKGTVLRQAIARLHAAGMTQDQLVDIFQLSPEEIGNALNN